MGSFLFYEVRMKLITTAGEWGESPAGVFTAAGADVLPLPFGSVAAPNGRELTGLSAVVIVLRRRGARVHFDSLTQTFAVGEGLTTDEHRAVALERPGCWLYCDGGRLVYGEGGDGA